MDPGEVPEELQGLTEIGEMLIARVFIVISEINFSQDIQELATRLPRHPLSLKF
ncbi:hypothetical protein RhiirA4_412305 [Rhizophagus irregularis]|uniref:DUF6570 domain-containing protein n=1 Tax=Rhizophagus irregularis TaxID=588596 RepID=A0A2I1HJI3_9GLOM|nr:hypothetical protein RhiirA4_412305 [Rhizophagus irregularis]